MLKNYNIEIASRITLKIDLNLTLRVFSLINQIFIPSLKINHHNLITNLCLM